MLQPFHGVYTMDPESQASAYLQKDAELSPVRIRTELARYGITIDMSPSEHGAVFEFTTRSEEPLRLRFDFDAEHNISWPPGKPWIQGWTSDAFEGEDLVNFSLKFVGEFSVAPVHFETAPGGGWLEFPAGEKRIRLKLAASFISHDFAELSLKRELDPVNSPEELASQGAEIWEDLLGRIDIESEYKNQVSTFYSCLYRCLLFPRFLDEMDAEGRIVHYSPYDGKIHDGRLCTDTGFWDTYRTLMPLLTLVYPDVATKMMEGWVNVCKASDWSPKWPSPGARDCMIGTHFNVVVADMVIKGLTDWDVAEVYKYLRKDAEVPSKSGRAGRRGLESLQQLGYVAEGHAPYSVSSTMDYAYDDFCVAQVARFLGREEEAETLLNRSENYRNLFDAKVGFMRPRDQDGNWIDSFDEFAWGGPYIEGGPWQHSFNVPHDISGLADLHGGNSALCRKLDEMLATPPHFEASAYGREIHEMTEMALAPFGQYAHSNQPVHNYLFLFAQCGQTEKTDHWVGRVLEELYSFDDFPGDEDNGEMAAWYIWATLGLYPTCPGKAEYLKLRPRIRKAVLSIPGYKPIDLIQNVRDWQHGEFIAHLDLLSG